MEQPPAPDGPEKVPPEESKSIGDKAAETYRWWDNLATLNAEDPLWLGAAKIGIRLLGIVLMLLLSPLILVGLFIALLAVL